MSLNLVESSTWINLIYDDYDDVNISSSLSSMTTAIESNMIMDFISDLELTYLVSSYGNQYDYTVSSTLVVVVVYKCEDN